MNILHCAVAGLCTRSAPTDHLANRLRRPSRIRACGSSGCASTFPPGRGLPTGSMLRTALAPHHLGLPAKLYASSLDWLARADDAQRKAVLRGLRSNSNAILDGNNCMPECKWATEHLRPDPSAHRTPREPPAGRVGKRGSVPVQSGLSASSRRAPRAPDRRHRAGCAVQGCCSLREVHCDQNTHRTFYDAFMNLSSQVTLKCSSATGPHNVAELQTSL
mmetsp:Transcript_26849/g.86714  ORF Transcript_26849/g.86714 Transcript_26849/m.86714 type:complete len:219 (-) Transcript_26849:181-837(-)